MNHQVVIAVVVLCVKLYQRPRVRRGKYAPACRRGWAGKSPKMPRMRHKTGECGRKQTNCGPAGTSFCSGASVLNAPGQFTAAETSDVMDTFIFRVTDSVTVFGDSGMRGQRLQPPPVRIRPRSCRRAGSACSTPLHIPANSLRPPRRAGAVEPPSGCAGAAVGRDAGYISGHNCPSSEPPSSHCVRAIDNFVNGSARHIRENEGGMCARLFECDGPVDRSRALAAVCRWNLLSVSVQFRISGAGDAALCRAFSR